MSGSEAYLIGRDGCVWPEEAAPSQDLLFAAIRKDGTKLEGLEFRHCTFANVSFKETKLEQCRFVDCAFLNCYFRKSQMIGSYFVGCKFISCEFPKVTIQSCDFKYSRFDNCSLPFDELEHSLPREPNLRQSLCQELALTAEHLGHYRDARGYRLRAIEAQQQHLKAAVLSQSEWYESHYPGLRKVRALVSLVAHWLNGLVWGHGEKWWILLRNIIVLSFGIFPLLLWLMKSGVRDADGSISLGDLVWLSVTTLIPIDGANSLHAASLAVRLTLASEAFIGVVAAGLFVTLLVKALLK